MTEDVIAVASTGLFGILNWAEGKLASKRAARQEWDSGKLCGSPARRHRKTGECQFVLWQAGEQGHAEDFWIRFDSSWWSQFLPNV
jgi:hypothetical protein